MNIRGWRNDFLEAIEDESERAEAAGWLDDIISQFETNGRAQIFMTTTIDDTGLPPDSAEKKLFHKLNDNYHRPSLQPEFKGSVELLCEDLPRWTTVSSRKTENGQDLHELKNFRGQTAHLAFQTATTAVLTDASGSIIEILDWQPSEEVFFDRENHAWHFYAETDGPSILERIS